MTESDTIGVPDLPEEFEKFYISHLLEESDWNVSEASRKAQMFRQNLQQKIRKYSLRPEGGEESRRKKRGKAEQKLPQKLFTTECTEFTENLYSKKIPSFGVP